jgi:hypothetical protein
MKDGQEEWFICLVQFHLCIPQIFVVSQNVTGLECSLLHLIPQALFSTGYRSIKQTPSIKKIHSLLAQLPCLWSLHPPSPVALLVQKNLHLGRDREPAFRPALSFSGPFFIKSASPKSFHAASLTFCVALWIPNAACWSGTTSSSSSGLIGWLCGGT